MRDAAMVLDLMLWGAVMASLALPFLAMALAGVVRAHVKLMARQQATREALSTAERRLADVEAIRRAEFVATHRGPDDELVRFDGPQFAMAIDGDSFTSGVRVTATDGQEHWMSWAKWVEGFRPLGEPE